MDKPLPRFETDEALEQFIEQDISDYINAENFRPIGEVLRPVGYEFQPKNASVNLRFPAPLLAAVKEQARREGIPYQKYIRMVVERSLPPSSPA